MGFPAGSRPAGSGGGGGGGGGGPEVVTSYGQFLANPAVSSVGGVHTVDGLVEFAGTIIWPAGESVVYAETGVMASPSWQAAILIFDVDGPAISGPVMMTALFVVNVNTGALSWCIEVSSSMGRIPGIFDSTATGIRGVRFVNVLGALTVSIAASLDAASALGWEFAGVIGAAAITRISSLVGSVSQVGVNLDSSLVIAAEVVIQSMASTLSLPTQHVVSISDAVTLAAGAVLHFTGCSHNGPQDRMFAQGPGLMNVEDLRLVAKGNPSAADWTATATAARLDAVNPLLVALPVAPSAPVSIPYADGITALEVEASTEIRFSLFKDPLDITRWWLEYLGPIPAARGTIGWEVLMERVGGGQSDITICSELNPSVVAHSLQQDDGGVFTDFTMEAQSEAADDVPLLPATIAVADATYFGADPSLPTGPEIFKIEISQSGVGVYALVWEYWNGAWVAAVSVDDDTSSFTAAPGPHDVLHDPQPDWATTTVNGVAAFYMRARLTSATSLATQPMASQVFSYMGFAVVESTVSLADSRAEKQNIAKGGDVEMNPGDRVHPALENLGTGHVVRIFDVTQAARVFP